MRRIVTLPETESAAGTGEAAHFRALEQLYAGAPINRLFASRLDILAPGHARITFETGEDYFHAAGATHGTLYFKIIAWSKYALKVTAETS